MSDQRLTTGFNSAGLSMTRNIPSDNPLAASFLLSARSMTAKGARAGSNAADSDPDSTDTRALPSSLALFLGSRGCLLVRPLKITDVLANLRIAEILVGHGHTGGLLQHRLGIRVSFQHLVG